MNKIDIGLVGENITCKEIMGRGFLVFTRNFRSKYGEIDIIAIKDKVIYFIEVKTSLSRYSLKNIKSLSERIGVKKINNIRRTAEVFISNNKEIDFESMCLGVSFINLNKNKKTAKLNIQFLPL